MSLIVTNCKRQTAKSIKMINYKKFSKPNTLLLETWKCVMLFENSQVNHFKTLITSIAIIIGCCVKKSLEFI